MDAYVRVLKALQPKKSSANRHYENHIDNIWAVNNITK